MGLDDLMSTESAFVAAATATVFSPRTRETLRRGAVLGVAGALKVGDVVAGAARGATRGVRGQEKVAAAGGNTGSGSRSRSQRSSSRSSRRSSSSSRSGSSSSRSSSGSSRSGSSSSRSGSSSSS